MPLSDIQIRNSKSNSKPYKLSDGEGLCLIVNPSGKKWWRFRYRFDGKEQSISFGTYPDVPLVKAREKRTEARRQVAAGINPSSLRKAVKEETHDTFENVAREWHAKFIKNWTPLYAGTILRRLERDIFPVIGHKAIRELKAPDILAALRLIEARGTGRDDIEMALGPDHDEVADRPDGDGRGVEPEDPGLGGGHGRGPAVASEVCRFRPRISSTWPIG